MKMIRLLMMLLIITFLIIDAVTFPAQAASPEASAAAGGENLWLHSIYFENDLFTGTDSHYTNGIKYVQISPDLSPAANQMGNLPKKVLETVHSIPFIRNSPPQTSHKVEFAFGQKMFTPEDTAVSELIPDDRPYAGWTYLATAYHHKSDLSLTRSVMDTLELQLGIVGPDAMAEHTQKLIHRLRDLDIPNGWDNQLSNEPGLVVAWERKWLYHPVQSGLGWDTVFHTGFTLGNVSTTVNTGMEIRLGWNIPRSFGVSLIRPAGSTRMGHSNRPGCYLVLAADGRYVIRNIFLDGNTFTNSHSVDKREFIADLGAGLAYSHGRFMITLTQVLRTPQFYGQSDPHAFGAVSASWFF